MNAGCRALSLMIATLGLAACGESATLPVAAGMGPDPELPPPEETLIPTVNIAPATGWPEGVMPSAAPGLRVVSFADGLEHPRWLYVLPNGDVLVAETNAPPRPGNAGGIRGWVMKLLMQRAGAGGPSADRITLLRDADGDGVAETRSVFLDGLHSPFGMALVGSDLYVANTDALVRFPYETDQLRIEQPGETVVALPAGPINHHWTKNVIASPDGSRLYVAVGSNSNVAENGMAAEEGRAAIWEIDPATGEHRIYASGLRNPVGLAFEPETGALWTTVNERDELGSDLVPDYLTSVGEGAFYGWPTAISATIWTTGSSRSGPIWSRRRWFRTMRSAPTRPRSGSHLRTVQKVCPPPSATARSSVSTAPGTGDPRAATRSSSCPSRTGSLPAIRSTC